MIEEELWFSANLTAPPFMLLLAPLLSSLGLFARAITLLLFECCESSLCYELEFLSKLEEDATLLSFLAVPI